ncbi:type II secretion system protein [Candidatus Daviesbacteria bacterium]|nr:type II secretion system protein [Candidatus Daviesbacteria bacterium]
MPKNSGFTQHHKDRIRKSGAGFTLIELLVVISIISILSVVGFVSFQAVRNSTLDAKRRADIDAIKKAYETNYDPTANGGQGGYKPLTEAMFASGKIPTPDGTTNTSYIVVGPDINANYNNTNGSGDTVSGDNFSVCAPLGSNIGNNSCVNAQDSVNCFCKTSSGGGGPPTYPAPAFQTINLTAGFNFVGLTVDKGSSYTLGKFYTDLGGEENGILSIATVAANGDYYLSDCSDGCQNNTSPVTVGMAFFINADGSSNSQIQGVQAVQTKISLLSGYTGISFAAVPASINKAKTLLNAINTGCTGCATQIFQLEGASFSVFSVGGGGDGFAISPGIGYMIFSRQSLDYLIPLI